MYSTRDPELLLCLLRTAMRQWGAFLDTQIAIERALDVDVDDEIRNYISDLAPGFVDFPDRLTAVHVQGLSQLCGRRAKDG